ncbi:MAG: MerR family transcriptional regulator [Actinomycetes bacterium]
MSAPPPTEYRIEELAERTGTTVRNIRAYQDRGLLPPPRRAGRVGLYDEGHVARLTLVAEMLDRGWTLASIGELMEAWQHGQDLGDLVGLGAAITAPWSDEEPFTLTVADLAERFGGELPGSGVEQAVALGVLEPTDDGEVRVLRPRLLEAGIALYRAGIPMELVLDHAQSLRADIDRIAERFVDLAATELFDAVPDPIPAEELPRLTELVLQLRPLAQKAVDAELAVAMERHVRARLGERIDRIVGPAPDQHGPA